MPISRHVVVKLGGSLLDWKPLREAFPQWLAQQAPVPHLVIVGGGRLADVFREYQPLHRLNAEAAHWLCVRTMQVNLHLAQKLWPEARIIHCLSEVDFAHQFYLFDTYPYLSTEEAALPHDWSVTSDSIAARLAETSLADEVVLLKSCLPNPEDSISQLSEAGYVDEYFPKIASHLRKVRFVNLRAAGFDELCIRRA